MRSFAAFGCVLLLGLLMAPDAMAQRVTAGQVVLYGFDEGMGDVIHDVSGYGTPLDLTVADPGNTSWVPGGGLSVNIGTIVSSGAPATKLIDRLMVTNEITIEAWLTPANTTQNGPARIVTCSADPYFRNFHLGQGVYNQDSDIFSVRLRTTATSTNGEPELYTDPGTLTTNLIHVIYTRTSTGLARIYVDGGLDEAGTRGGDFSNWDGSYPFALANEIVGGRPWLGEYRLVAVFDRALSDVEVLQNFNAGPSLAPTPPTITTQPVSQTVFEGQSATFTVSAVGTPPLTYEWYRDGGPIPSSDSPTYNTGPVTLADDGAEFYCVVTNDQGSDTSDSAFLTVNEFTGFTRIMPLGDSITYDNHGGTNPPEGERRAYRYPLWQLLKNGGYNTDMVGSENAGYDLWPDSENEGHPGWRDDQIAANIYGWLQLNPADIIVLHIGTNGFDTSPADVEDILDEIDRWEADYSTPIVVVLARIINRSSSSSLPDPDYLGSHSATTTFNDNVQAMAEARVGDNIVIVDLEHGAGIDYRTQPAGDMYDSLHPNDDGYAKMAWVLYQALQALLPPPALTCPAGIVHYWKMEKVVPTYVNQYGTLATSPLDFYPNLFPSAPTQVTGRVGYAQEFGGAKYSSGNIVDVADDNSLDWGPGDSFTLEFWMLKQPGTLGGSSVNDNEVILGRDDASTQQHWWVGVTATSVPQGRITFHLRDNNFNGDDILSDNPVDDGQWHHIVAVRDATLGVNGTNLMYVDGVLQVDQSDIAYPGGFSADDVPMNVGWLNLSDGFYYRGAVDEIAVYDRALDSAEIGAHYAAGLGGLGYCITGDVAPTIISDPLTAAYVGEPYTYDVDAVGSPPPTYELTTSPAGMSIDPVSGLIDWTPASVSEFDVTVRVYNTEGEDLQSFTITVTERPVCPPGMVAYWQLDESGGPTYMDIYDGHDAMAGDAPTAIPGQVNGAQRFNGTSDGLNVTSHPDFDWPLGASFSIEYWLRSFPHDPPQNEVVIGRDPTSGSPGGSLHWWTGLYDGSGAASFILIATNGDGGSGNFLEGDRDLRDGLWHHIVAIRNSNTGYNSLFVDGVEEDSKLVSYGAGFEGPGTPLNIGWINLSGLYRLEGDVDELAIYNRALEIVEIQEHYDNGLLGQGYCQEGPTPPVITSTPVTAGQVGVPYTYDVDATGNPTPTYAVTTAPAGMTIDPVTGIITWTPALDGVFPVTVEATNTEGTDTQPFDITVTIPPVCPSDMTAYWRLEETGGTTYEDYYDGHQGTASPSPPTPDPGGIVGGCQSFDGTSNYITVADHPDFDWASDGSYTVELWARFTYVASRNKVMIGRDEGPGSPHWWVGGQQNTGQIVWNHRDADGNGIALTSTGAYNDDVWHQIVILRDESLNENRLYIDGGMEIVTGVYDYTANFGAATTVGIGYMAYNLNPDYFYQGLLDEIAFYSRALTLTEIEQHYADGLAGQGYCTENAEAPVITTAPVTSATVGEPYIYDVDATGNPPATYVLLTAPLDMSIDPVTGIITWMPAAAGDVDVEVEASNIVGSDVQPFTIHVTEPMVCPPDISHFWNLDETGGPPFLDSVGSSNASCSDCPTPVAGQIGGAQWFDGLSGEGSGNQNAVTVPHDGTLDWAADASFSMAYWMKTDQNTSGNRVILGRDGGGLHWWVGCDDNGTVRFQLRDNSGNGLYLGGIGTVMNDDVWHYVVAVRDESANWNGIYVDGAIVDEGNYDYLSDFSSSAELEIGWLSTGGGYHFHGAVDEIAIYDRTLPVEEIQQQYLNGLYSHGYCDATVPTIVTLAVTDGTVGAEYTYDVDAVGHPAPTYALTTAPAGMTIDPVTGVITWTPLVPGLFDVEVEAGNASGTDIQAFTLEVLEPSPFPDCMISWWRLDETAGGEHYDLVSGHHAYVILGDPIPAPGLPALGGGALEFDRVLDEVAVPDNDQYEWTGDDSFSIEFWMKNTFSGDNQVIMGRDGGTASTLHWWVGVLNGGTAYFGLHDDAGGSANVGSATDITDDVWHHIVAARDGVADMIRLYLDGVKVDSTSIDYAGDFVGDATLDIGHMNLSDHFRYDGVVDEIAIYCRALYDEEVVAHFNAGDGVEYSEPVGPMIMTTAVTVAIIDQPYAYDVDATGVPTASYALTDSPAGMTIDPVTGLISWTPTAPGGFDVTVEASNIAGTDSQVFTIQVPLPAICPADMLAYWKLDESTGPTYYDALDGHHTTPALGAPAAVPGQVNGAQYFDGADGLNVPAHADFDWGVGDSFSFETWIKVDPHNPPQNEIVIGRDDPASSLHWWLGLGDPSGLATFVCIATDGSGYSGGADVLVGTSDLRDGLWHHVVVIREAGGTSRLYVDTGLEAEKTVVYTAGFEGSTPLTVGWFNLSGNYEMQGIIDELAVYGRALELTEIEQHYSNGLVGMGYCEESSYPLITSVPVTSGTVGMPYSYNVEATGNPVPTFALTISPEGMEIDPASGVISWLAYATGDFDVTVEASNTWGVDQQNYTISCSHLTEPVISTISDVGNDEGGQVRLIWHRSDFDAADDGVDITSYGIYRRQDQFKSAVGVTKGEHLRLDGWDYIETIPARGDDIYQYVAPTLCDSTIMDGMCWSVFFISAMTPDPLVFYDSLPDSGYSVDNLAPPAPSNIVVAYDQAGNVLNWDASEAADFHSYLIYRDWSADFEPGPDNLVTMLRETSWFDDAAGMPGDPLAAFYMIAAQDSAGNVGEVSAPEHTTSVDDLVPTRYALHNNVPNPFNPLTSIKYDLPRASHVSLCIFDVSGRLVRVIVDGEMQQPGRHEAVWNGRDNAGRGVAAGLYFYRLTADTFTDTRRMLLVK